MSGEPDESRGSRPVRRGGDGYSYGISRSLPYKNQDDNFEHNYGHGTQHLSVVFATIMTLAFLVDQVQQRCCALFRAVWRKLGSKRLLWERMRALFAALLYGWEKLHPIWATDTS